MQQVTINLPSAHPVRALQGLAKAIALPAEHRPERFPSFPALERTAVMAFTQPQSLDLPTGADTKIMVSRQAGYPAWAQRSVGAANYGYQWTMSAPTSNPESNLSFEVDSAINDWALGTRLATNTLVGMSGGGAADLTYPPIGQDSGTGPRPWVYVGDGMSYLFVVHSTSALGATTNFRVDYEAWSSPGEVAIKTSIITNFPSTTNWGTASTFITSPDAVWIRPISVELSAPSAVTIPQLRLSMVVGNGNMSYTGSISSAGTVSMTSVYTTRPLLPFTVSSEFANSQLPWFATRTTSVGFLGTNVTQILSKAGTVLAGRVSPNVVSPWQVSKSYITALHPAEKAWLPLETGVYTYCPPSTDLANFWDYTLNTAAGAKACPVYRLDNDSLVNVLFLTAGATSESLACTTSWHIEFRTSSALFQVALSGLTLETFHQAQLSLAAAGFFFDNPDHKSILTKVITAVNKIAPYAMAALGVAHPKAAAIAKAGYNAGAALVNMARSVPVKNGPMRLPTTTAAASGMLGVRPRPKAKQAKAKAKRR